MPRIKYACCSHGPQHLRTRPHCGFAHVLHELDFPERIHSRLWCDRSHEHEGPAGIDIFVGQEYTPKQLDRLFAMLANEGLVGIPAWARQLAWFLGHGSTQYANDGDFGYFARMQIVSHTNFRTMKDSNGQTLNDRMQTRMATQTLFEVYVAKTAWSDNDKEYRDTTPLYWGAQSNQYLDIQAESAYYKIGCSDCDDPWWYMMPVNIQGSSLTYGGWAPPTYFTASEETLTLYEVEVPTLTLQKELYVNESAHAVLAAEIPVHSTYQVYVDGSCNHFQGIAAGWIFAGKYLSGRASLAGYFTGSMASELLGICGGLAAATTLANDQVSFVFYIDAQGALDQVFGGAEPGRDGLHNVPALKLARMLLHHLMAISPVQYFKVASHANYAHCIAKHEQRRRLTQDNWLSCCDVWPADMDDSWQSVFRLVASNTRAGPAGCVSELPSSVLQSFR